MRLQPTSRRLPRPLAPHPVGFRWIHASAACFFVYSRVHLRCLYVCGAALPPLWAPMQQRNYWRLPSTPSAGTRMVR